MPSDNVLRLTVLLPLYNDWRVAALLLEQLDQVFLSLKLSPKVILVDDGSTVDPPPVAIPWQPQAIESVELLELYRNMGHQRALCVGMVHVYLRDPEMALLVMDADGEDSPQTVPALLERFYKEGGTKAVFAARGRRLEGLPFLLAYQLYRAIHRALVGFDVRIGNFSLLPAPVVARLVRSGDLWNHYAACALKSRLPLTTIPVDRAKRLYGKSQMGFTALVIHGLSAMSVYNEAIGVRLLVMAALATLVSIAAASREWTVVSATGLVATLLFNLLVLGGRSGRGFLPVRDCPEYVRSVRTLAVAQKPDGRM